VETLERAAALEPSNPSALLVIATYHFERSKNPRVSTADRQASLEQSVTAADRALAVDPDSFDALVHKSLALRELAARDTNPGRREALIAEADALRARAATARQDAASSRPINPTSRVTAPAPPPPPPVPGAGDIQWVYGRTSYTAKGNAATLEKVKDVRPVYPPMAITHGVHGNVVVEAKVNKRGEVVDARVIESVPMLNQSTIDAVRQWRFDPATVAPSGDRVLLRVTATFTLPQ
jgi:TonB family protein